MKEKFLGINAATTPPTLAGLFFCLASAEGAGLLFCPDAIQPNTSVYSVFCCVNANYTAHAAKQRTGLYSGFSCDCTRSTAHNTRQAQAAIIPLAQRRRAYTRPDTLNLYQIPPPRRTLYRSAQAAYYNKVYKRVQGCALLWIHAQRCNIAQTMPARRRSAPTVCGLLASTDTLSAVQTRRTF